MAQKKKAKAKVSFGNALTRRRFEREAREAKEAKQRKKDGKKAEKGSPLSGALKDTLDAFFDSR